jgi:hypothetical protein
MPADEHQHDLTQPAGPPGKQGRRGSRRVAVLAGVVAAGLLAGAGVAFATTGSPAHPVAAAAAVAPSAAPSRPPSQVPMPHRLPFRPGSMHGGGFGAGSPFGAGGPFGVVHGQYVVTKPGGGYQTIDFQTGKVTAVSSTSITLRSPDGYVHSYVVTGSTSVDAQRGGISSVKAGHQVSVQATVGGGAATAARIADLTLLQQGAQHYFGQAPVQPSR